ncbi:MAG: DUF6198 family protein [Eubacteriales bacterium]|nr:DUF6198 family protein [Eubacteriales bacterium]
MKENVNGYIRKSLIVLASIVLLSFGVIFVVGAAWGQDPLSTLELGVENTFGIKMGTVDLIIEILVLVAAFFINRKYIHIGTVLYAFLFGPVMNFWFATVSPLLPAADTIPMKLLFIAVGILIMSFALAFYIPVEMGYQCSDILAFMIGDAIHKGYGYGMTISGVIMFAVGVLLGAPWGIGTVIATFAIGPLVTFFVKLTTPFVRKLAGMPAVTEAEAEAA